MAVRVVEFLRGGTKLEIVLSKNQQNQRILKNVINKEYAPKLIFFNK